MADMPPKDWNTVPLSQEELDLQRTLTSGQAFRWVEADGVWHGAIGALGFELAQEADSLLWRCSDVNQPWPILGEYLSLGFDLLKAQGRWLAAEPRLAQVLNQNSGLRILKQPFIEVLFAFQCATCNTVVKITRSVRRLAERYGEPVLGPSGTAQFAFPTIDSLAKAREQDLRDDLWGFRAPRVIELARELASRGPDWFETMERASYEQAHVELCALPGIGAKVADCICLFGLGHTQAVPIDTHVRKMVAQWWRPDLSERSLTPRIYNELAEEVRSRFGMGAGWVQQYLFLASMGSK